MNDETICRLQNATLDRAFADWVRGAVRRFAADYDPSDATTHREVIRQYKNVYEDFVAQNFPTDDGPNWVNCSRAEVELAMREDFENTDKFRLATIWSKDGSRCLSCGRDWNGKWIDLSTLSSRARLTLVALYLMSIGDSVLLAASPPDWEAWRSSDKPMEKNIAWLVSDYPDPSDTRFERIEIVANWVLAEWQETLSSRPEHSLNETVSAPDRAHPAATSPDIGKFKWTPFLLEGYVIAMLREKESEDLTERVAVKWIAERSRRPEPSRSTLRKTFSWKKKRGKPRTTNEAQSGVSPSQNADATVPHDEVIDTVLDIEEMLHRELVDAEREAVAWTLQQTGTNEEERAEAISQLIEGFRNAGI
jgi:hypothetical protein